MSESIWNETIPYNAHHLHNYITNSIKTCISKITEKLGTTEFVYFFACTSIVLQRYLGVDDMTFAVPATLRDDLHQLTDGLFVNTLLCRVKFNPTLTWREYIARVEEVLLLAQKYRAYPLDKLAQMLWTIQKKSISSFCSLMFNYSRTNTEKEEIRVYSKHAKMSLSIDVIVDERNKQTSVLFEWADDVLDSTIIERISNSLTELCSRDIPWDQKLNAMDVLSSSEMQLLKSFSESEIHNDTHVLTDKEMHIQFEMNTEKHPDNIAVVCDEDVITYQSLNKMASQIAEGICTEINADILKSYPVLLFTKKDIYSIAMIIGVWKSGGHFLPVSISNQNALKDISSRITPGAIIYHCSDEDYKTMIEASFTCPVINVETLIENTYNRFLWSEDASRKTEIVAYAIQTSGSTGVPKLCKISHRNLNVVSNAWKTVYNMDKYEVNVFQWAPVSFDVFVGDLVRSLICMPGKLVLCPDERRLDVSYIQHQIKYHNITFIEVTPHFASHLIEGSNASDFESLKILVLGSDVTHSHIFENIKRILRPDQRVINSYGMTEATIDSTCFDNQQVPCTRSGTVPIGKPLPGVSLHVLDKNTLLPSPIGTVGELYISGNVIASGDTEVVAIGKEKFALKTGDICCWLPSGNLELYGRSDDVVKLRGFRISTLEIEKRIMLKIKDIKETCVSVLTDNKSSKTQYLCAFVEMYPNHSKDMNVNKIKQILSRELPYYMVPDLVNFLEKLPTTKNGKIDRKGLPSLSDMNDLKCKRIPGKHDGKESETANVLKALFAQAMDLKDMNMIDVNLTFMENGGHSLTLVRFCSLIKKETKFKIGIVDLFSYPSILTLANQIESKHILESGNKVANEDCSTDSADIVITGLGLRLPGGIMSLPQLWEVLQTGEDLVQQFPQERISDFKDCSKYLPTTDTYRGAFLDRIDQFDNEFFHIPPGEAKFMSPEQRLLLQVATEALLEGENSSNINGANIGVFLSTIDIGYSQLDYPDEAICVSGLLPGMVATRIVYQWNLKGPSMLVDTACSSSLMALKHACESIKKNECDGALVGGANLVIYPGRTGVFGNAGILSPDFSCRPFDKNANGTVVGEGVLCLYVERLSSAIKQRKHIYGIVNSIASNSVGHGNGITAPSSTSQIEVINKALTAAGIKAADVGYIETHGTGTKLGDRVEISALSSIFKENVAIGTSKSMFGHLDTTAGLLGLVKVLATFMFNKIPPSANFKIPNSDLKESALSIVTEIQDWDPNKSGKRIAGISAFGLTGTNCHAIISNHDPKNVKDEGKQNQSCFPIFFRGKSFNYIKKQAWLYNCLIRETMQKTSLNSLKGMCFVIAKRFHEMCMENVGHDQFRMAINVKKPPQAIRLLSIVQSTSKAEDLIQICKMRSDMHVSFPGSCIVNSEINYLRSFIQNNHIDISDIFGEEIDNICPAFGVTLILFEENRHWLDRNNRLLKNENLYDLLDRKVTESKEIIRSLPLMATDDLTYLQGRFCSSDIIKLLRGTNLSTHVLNDRSTSLKESFEITGMLEQYEKLFFVMIRELLNNGFIRATGKDETVLKLDSYIFNCSDILDVDPTNVADHAMKKYPSWADCFRFPLYCSQHLRSVLWGNMSPLSVIYPQGDLNFMFRFDKLGDPLGDVYYNTYMQSIASYADQLAGIGKKIRILEVGAGMGHVTRQLLPKFTDIGNIEYWFTDLGKAFVENAKNTFENYMHSMKFCTFDITKSALEQGVIGTFDIVISYNVIHTTDSIKTSVVNLKSCLGEDGTLFIIESAKNETWATLAWGVLDGWWFFKDYDLRPFEPMMEPKKWEHILSNIGFASVVSCPFDEEDRNEVEKFLFVCCVKPLNLSESRRTRWWENIDTDFENKIELEDDADLTDTNLSTEQIVQNELKQIWSELLGVQDINPEDDFNSLGGESLIAVQMMTLVRKRIGYQLEIADTFGYPSLASLANFIFCNLEQKLGKSLNCDVVTERGKDGFSQTDSNSFKENEASKMLMFPGQGSQKVGMCRSMKGSAEARCVFQRAEKILGYNVLDVCLQNDEELIERLKSTAFVQVALFVGCLAKIEQIKIESPHILANINCVAGLSVGEFCALVYAGVLKFEDALEIVRKRGQAMEEEANRLSTSMASIYGPRMDQLRHYLEVNFKSLEISTYLGDNQHTVAGSNDDIDSFVDYLNSKDKEIMNVVDVRKLRVAGAFHSIYMKKATVVVDPLIDSVEFRKPCTPVLMNVTGSFSEDTNSIKEQLKKQLVEPVQWRKTVVSAYENNVRQFIEVSPSRVLTSIVKNRISDCEGCLADFFEV
ncbi:polyketide synthase PksN-like [Mytilus californianus]|uniref:polyketide synthase PksN-like n=1 Tax=Mytilus californianus TaxID=6549 RepID=UPI002247294E|nr:polyketide synthase PksN-like [Mytilus californianus]